MWNFQHLAVSQKYRLPSLKNLGFPAAQAWIQYQFDKFWKAGSRSKDSSIDCTSLTVSYAASPKLGVQTNRLATTAGPAATTATESQRILQFNVRNLGPSERCSNYKGSCSIAMSWTLRPSLVQASFLCRGSLSSVTFSGRHWVYQLERSWNS